MPGRRAGSNTIPKAHREIRYLDRKGGGGRRIFVENWTNHDYIRTCIRRRSDARPADSVRCWRVTMPRAQNRTAKYSQIRRNTLLIWVWLIYGCIERERDWFKPVLSRDVSINKLCYMAWSLIIRQAIKAFLMYKYNITSTMYILGLNEDCELKLYL